MNVTVHPSQLREAQQQSPGMLAVGTVGMNGQADTGRAAQWCCKHVQMQVSTAEAGQDIYTVARRGCSKGRRSLRERHRAMSTKGANEKVGTEWGARQGGACGTVGPCCRTIAAAPLGSSARAPRMGVQCFGLGLVPGIAVRGSRVGGPAELSSAGGRRACGCHDIAAGTHIWRALTPVECWQGA